MTPHQAWGDMLTGPVQRRPILWTLGAIAAGSSIGLAGGYVAGLVLARRRAR